MNILVSSTRQWNPGDEFILQGIRNLLGALPWRQPINWILYDRNPDLFADGYRHPVHRPGLLSNTLVGGDASWVDLAVVAGTPEWTGLPLRGFYRMVREYEIPLLLLGAGYIDAPIAFTEDEMYCWKNRLQLAVVRDGHAWKALTESGVKAQRLPCPALFASSREYPPAGSPGKIGLILQSDQVQNHSIPRALKHACLSAANQFQHLGKKVELVCHYIHEFGEFAKAFPAVRYSYEAGDYLKILSEYDLIVSTRLHGAILANSLGKPALLVDFQDSRCSGAAEAFPWIKMASPKELETAMESVSVEKFSREFPAWKKSVWNQYMGLLETWQKAHGSERERAA